MEHFLSRVGEKLSRFVLGPFVLHIVFIVKYGGKRGVLNGAMRVKMVVP